MEIPIQVAVRIQNASFIGAESNFPNVDTDNENEQEDEANAKIGIDANGNKKRVKESSSGDDLVDEMRCCVQAIPIAAPMLPISVTGNVGISAGFVQVGPHSFPVTHALSQDCTQLQIYQQAVLPLVNLLLEGFDASVVLYGQSKTGKTYTLYGPGFDCVFGEADQGIVQRCVREIFSHITNHPERNCFVHIGWVEICGENIRDLIGVGNVHCANVSDVFQWLQVGMSMRDINDAEKSESDGINVTPLSKHTLFTLTLEQQWVSKEGLIQHRLSTASFSDLCGTERLFMLNPLEQPASLPKDSGLQALEQVVNTLTDSNALYNANGNVPYNQTTLTTLLKDSFGGRAQTLVILCVSPLERDAKETMCNLQFAFKVQCVRNFVVMNTFSDDSTPISPDGVPPSLGGGMVSGISSAIDNFGLQFAASQWFKLVSNAEGLFSKLIANNTVTDVDKEQIEEWLFLKQECEECLSSSEVIRSQKQLVPIQETEEPMEDVCSEPETSGLQNSDNESDSESQHPDLSEKVESLMEELRIKTDSLVTEKHNDFIAKQPEAVMESQESLLDKTQQPKSSNSDTKLDKTDERKPSLGGRRRSIQPGASLSSAEIAMLNRVATREQSSPRLSDDLLESSSDCQLRPVNNTPIDLLQKKLRKLDTDIDAKLRQIKEVEQTIQIKHNIITELVKNNDTRTTAKHRFHKKKSKLEAEYEKAKKQLAKAISQGKDQSEVERLRSIIEHTEQRLQDITSMKNIAGESGQKVKKLHQSIQESKKIIEDLQKRLKKEKKLRDQVHNDIRALKEKENTNKELVKLEDYNGNACSGKNLREVQARISHLDHVLREKSENLGQFENNSETTQEKEGLRHEIRNLRRTRDHLLEQRFTLDRKLKRDKVLTHREERKLLECDEAIEAIDAAIEFKNELICGHKSIDTSERLQREKGEQMLMARLNKLSPEEMRTLLYKYFTKVIDLRDSSRKLETQLSQLERERDAWEWKERVLSNAVRQARLEGERNAVLLQRQHEMKLTLMLRHLADETSLSSNSFNDHQHHQRQQQQQQQQQQAHQQQHYLRTAGLTMASHITGQNTGGPGTASVSSQYSGESDFTDFGFYKHTIQSNKLLKHKHNDIEIFPMSVSNAGDAITKYKPLEKIKDKERESKNKLFAKLQVLTRYTGQSSNAATNEDANERHNNQMNNNLVDNGNCTAVAPTEVPSVSGINTKKKGRKDSKETPAPSTIIIPEENLKRLMATPSSTKVTRQKNKIIIQDASRKQ